MTDDQLQAELMEATRLLRQLEWSGTAHGGYGSRASRCSICRGIKPGEFLDDGGGQYTRGKGHKEDCVLHAFLAEHEEG